MISLITQGQQQLNLGLWSLVEDLPEGIALATFERALVEDLPEGLTLDETDVDA